MLIRISENCKSIVEDLQLCTGVAIFVRRKQKIIIESSLNILFVVIAEEKTSDKKINK